MINVFLNRKKKKKHENFIQVPKTIECQVFYNEEVIWFIQSFSAIGDITPDGENDFYLFLDDAFLLCSNLFGYAGRHKLSLYADYTLFFKIFNYGSEDKSTTYLMMFMRAQASRKIPYSGIFCGVRNLWLVYNILQFTIIRLDVWDQSQYRTKVTGRL